jgi:hypothetical protein
MKKLYFLSALLFATAANAQFSLTTATHGLVTNNTVSYHPVTTTPSRGSAGAGVIWNFSTTAVDMTSTYSETYVTPTAKQIMDFPGTNVTMYTNTGDTTFYRQSTGSTVDSTILNGINYGSLTPSQKISFTDNDLIMKFPYDYNSAQFTDNVAGNGANGTSQTDIDAYGTLILSSGSYPVLRTKFVLSLMVTTPFGPAPLVISDFAWYLQNQRNPIMKFRKLESPLMNDSSMNINVLYTGIRQAQLNDSKVSVYPNPSKESFKLDVSTEKAGTAKIEIYSTTGELVFNEDLGTISGGAHTFDISTVNVASGAYMIKVITADGIGMKKFIKE